MNHLVTVKNQIAELEAADERYKNSFLSFEFKQPNGGTKLLVWSIASELPEKMAALSHSALRNLWNAFVCARAAAGDKFKGVFCPLEVEVIGALERYNLPPSLPAVSYASVMGLTVNHGGESLSGNSWGFDASIPRHFDFFAENPVENHGRIDVQVNLGTDLPFGSLELRELLGYCSRMVESIIKKLD